MNDRPAEPAPPILEYGDSSASGPTAFDVFIGSLLFVLSSICILCAMFIVFIALRHHLSPVAVLCEVIGVGLVIGMAYALFYAGRVVWTSERRQR